MTDQIPVAILRDLTVSLSRFDGAEYDADRAAAAGDMARAVFRLLQWDSGAGTAPGPWQTQRVSITDTRAPDPDPVPHTGHTDLADAYAEICAQMARELHIDFSVLRQGGNTFGLVGYLGPLRVHVSDWADGDLSLPDAERGYWVGFYLPDSAWSGDAESLIGDPGCRAEDLPKLVAFALSGYLRGDRHLPQFPGDITVVDYSGANRGPATSSGCCAECDVACDVVDTVGGRALCPDCIDDYLVENGQEPLHRVRTPWQ